MNPSVSKLWYIFLAVVSASCMGTIGTFSRFANLPAGVITFYRLAIATICLLFYMIISDKRGEIFHRPSKRTFINGVMLAAFMIFYIQSINYTTMALTVMFVYLSPLVCAVFAHFFFGERLTFIGLLCIIFALLGFTMMMEFSLNIEGAKDSSLGLIYATLSTATYSCFLLINRRPGKGTPYQSSLIQLGVGAICSLPFVLSFEALPSVKQSIWLISIGIIPGFLGILLAVKSLRELPTAIFGTVAYIETVVVIILGWVIFAETLGPLQLFGCFLIIGAGITQSLRHMAASNSKVS